MKKVIRLTESDLMRIVKRVIKETDDLSYNESKGKTEIVQGYGKDPYQYKRVMEFKNDWKDQYGFGGNRWVYYVARKGSSPKWIKVEDQKAIKEINRLYFIHSDNTSNMDTYGDKSKIDQHGGSPQEPEGPLKAAAEIFPCLEQQQIKRGGKKIAHDKIAIFEIGDWRYSVEYWSGKGIWMVKRNSKNPSSSDYPKLYKSCTEINFDEKISK